MNAVLSRGSHVNNVSEILQCRIDNTAVGLLADHWPLSFPSAACSLLKLPVYNISSL